MIQQGRFREDLLYRINAIQMEIPPLRDRKQDIPVLSAFFLRKFGVQYRKSELSLTEKVVHSLQDHEWPGNIRELAHAIEKAVILSDGKSITREHLFAPVAGTRQAPRSDSLNLEENERMVIEKALRKEQGNVSSAAKKLGINRSTLYQKMKKYGI
jgi:two-component system response regulator HydG